MAGLAAWLVVSATTLVGGQPYGEAYQKSQTEDRPLLVLVGADWCPGCRTMKQNVLPRLTRSGKLEKVEFAMVDADREPELARKLMRGNSIPQLILFSRGADGWRRTQLTGARSDQEVGQFVQQGVASHAERPMMPVAGEGASAANPMSGGQ